MVFYKMLTKYLQRQGKMNSPHSPTIAMLKKIYTQYVTEVG